MPEDQPRPDPGSRPTAWVLAAPGAGDNRQLATLVDVLNVDARWIDQIDSVATVLRDRLTGFRARTLPASKRERYSPPWPDLVLIAGGRGVIDARRIRHASGGRSRVVCLGRPWAPLAWFDLVITTPQYRLPAAENMITLDLPLNLPPTTTGDDLRYWRRKFEALPRPMLGVLLGGDSGSYRFDAESAANLARSINDVAGEQRGSAVVAGSPRTPQKAVELLTQHLEIPARVHAWRVQAPNPYASVLRLADALLVTGDSASMLAEACHSNKPVGVFDLRERARARLNRSVRARLPVPTRAVERLAASGLWIPARDMPKLQRRAVEAGRVIDSSVLLSGPRAVCAPENPLDKVRERVFELLER